MSSPTLGERPVATRVHSLTGSFEILADPVPETQDELVMAQRVDGDDPALLGWYDADGNEVFSATKPSGGAPMNHLVRKQVEKKDAAGNTVFDSGYVRAKIVVHDQNGEAYRSSQAPSIDEHNMPTDLLDKWRALGAETLAWAKPIIEAELETS